VYKIERRSNRWQFLRVSPASRTPNRSLDRPSRTESAHPARGIFNSTVSLPAHLFAGAYARKLLAMVERVLNKHAALSAAFVNETFAKTDCRSPTLNISC